MKKKSIRMDLRKDIGVSNWHRISFAVLFVCQNDPNLNVLSGGISTRTIPSYDYSLYNSAGHLF